MKFPLPPLFDKIHCLIIQSKTYLVRSTDVHSKYSKVLANFPLPSP